MPAFITEMRFWHLQSALVIFLITLQHLSLIAFIGVRIEYLPPYSPDLNPIEEAFSKIKAFIRRHGSLLVHEGDGMLFDLMECMDVITASDAIGYFTHAGYF